MDVTTLRQLGPLAYEFVWERETSGRKTCGDGKSGFGCVSRDGLRGVGQAREQENRRYIALDCRYIALNSR